MDMARHSVAVGLVWSVVSADTKVETSYRRYVVVEGEWFIDLDNKTS
jgi:hypothetical protein